MVESYSIMYVLYMFFHVFFIHPPSNGHLSRFHTFAIINNSAVNIEVHVSFQICVLFSLDKCPEVELLLCMVVLFSILWGHFILFLLWLDSLRVHEDSFLSVSLKILVTSYLSNNSRCDSCEVVSLCDFDFYFPDEWYWTSFYVLVGHL